MAEAAELLGRHLARIYALVRLGELVAIHRDGGAEPSYASTAPALNGGQSRAAPAEAPSRLAWAVVGLASGDEALAERFLEGHRDGYDGHNKKRGAKTHVAVDTLGHVLALVVTPASDQERAQVEQLAVRADAPTAC